MLLDKTETVLIGYPSASGTVALNSVTSIGDSAFTGTSLATVSLPMAVSIGGEAFGGSYYGGHYSAGLTVTLGPTVPTLGPDLFIYVEAKTVTVRVPSGATGYDDKWKNAFTGGNSNISLTVETYTP